MKTTSGSLWRQVAGLMLAPLVVGIAALALFLLGTVPGHAPSRTGLQGFTNVAGAESALGFKIVLPAYFPSYLSWPAATVEGRLEPVPTVRLMFLTADKRSQMLLIDQTVGSQPPGVIPWTEAVLHTVPAAINDVTGTLVVGRGQYDEPINAVYWTTGGFTFTVVTTQPVPELLRLARSMHP